MPVNRPRDIKKVVKAYYKNKYVPNNITPTRWTAEQHEIFVSLQP
jgi:hypothetical protein